MLMLKQKSSIINFRSSFFNFLSYSFLISCIKTINSLLLLKINMYVCGNNKKK